MFGPINVHYDVWSAYEEPTVYALREQQRIVNWTDVRGLTFSGTGVDYIQCLQLYNTSVRPIAIGDNLVFCIVLDVVSHQSSRVKRYSPSRMYDTLLSNNVVQCIISIEWIYCTTILT